MGAFSSQTDPLIRWVLELTYWITRPQISGEGGRCSIQENAPKQQENIWGVLKLFTSASRPTISRIFRPIDRILHQQLNSSERMQVYNVDYVVNGRLERTISTQCAYYSSNETHVLHSWLTLCLLNRVECIGTWNL